MKVEDVVEEFHSHINTCPKCSRTRKVRLFCPVGKEVVAGLDILEDRRVVSEDVVGRLKRHFAECEQCGDSLSIGCLCEAGYDLVDVWLDVAIRQKVEEAEIDGKENAKRG